MHRVVNRCIARCASTHRCSNAILTGHNALILCSKRWKAISFPLRTLSEGELSSDEVITRLKSLLHYCNSNNIDLTEPENKIFSMQAWRLLQKVEDDDVTSNISIDGVIDLLEAWNHFSRGWDKGLDGPSEASINQCANYFDDNLVGTNRKNSKDNIEVMRKSSFSSSSTTMEAGESGIGDSVHYKSYRHNISIPLKSSDTTDPDKNTINNEFLLDPGVLPQPRINPLDQTIDF